MIDGKEIQFEETWNLLKQNLVVVPANLKYVRVPNNLVGIRVLAEINEEVISELECCVRDLGTLAFFRQITHREKVILFGLVFVLSSPNFKFPVWGKIVLRVLSLLEPLLHTPPIVLRSSSGRLLLRSYSGLLIRARKKMKENVES